MKRIVLLLLLSASLISSVWAQTENIAVLVGTDPAILHIDDLTQNARFVHWADGLELSGMTIAEKANTFFLDYGVAFGVKNPEGAFLLEQNLEDKAGNKHLKFQQFHEGLPYFGAQIQLHFDDRDQLKTVNGVVFSDPTAPAEVNVSYFDAVSSAMRFITKTFAAENLSGISVEEVELQWYHDGLTMHVAGNIFPAYALVISNQNNIREHVFVDAQTGQAIDHFSANCTLLHRKLFLQNKTDQIWDEGESLPGALDNWQQIQLEATAQTYQFFSNTFQYQSFDNLDTEMEMIDQVSFLACPNASWNGVSANFCEEVSSDDVVAHEWGHAYTEHTSQLIYAWQAGAINEAYSDIWGETIDLLNGDDNHDAHRTDCDDNDRWKIAEDAIATNGPIRDMWSPSCHDHPGKLSDSTYHCTSSDFGGVHSNSGIVNHAYALLVDGGEYNGFTIEGIGLTKAAHLFWHAQRYYLTRTSDFASLADALEMACHDLKTVNLQELSISHVNNNLSQQSINTHDSLQLNKALLAVEMRGSIDQCDNTLAALISPAPPLCPHDGEAFEAFYIETFEEETPAWEKTGFPGDVSDWNERNWIVRGDLPDNRSGKAIYASTPNVGDCGEDLDHGLLRLESPVIVVPEDIDGDILLTFNHYFSFEKNRDGGNLKVQRNGNNWISLPPSAFLHNGYNAYLTASENPLSNQKAFTGADQGSVAGSWGTTQVKLSVIGARAGDHLVIRFEVGTDACDGWDGWYIDDLLLATCSAVAALPVEYLSFDAKLENKNVQLDWETGEELNNKGFHIERSFDGHQFATIGWVASKSEGSYQFVDNRIGSNKRIYYRLRQEDHDGKVAFSDIKSVNQEASEAWRIYPNPASDQLMVELASNTVFPIEIGIQTLDGRMLKSRVIRNENEITEFSLDNFLSGLYLIQLKNDHGVSYRHLVVE